MSSQMLIRIRIWLDKQAVVWNCFSSFDNGALFLLEITSVTLVTLVTPA